MTNIEILKNAMRAVIDMFDPKDDVHIILRTALEQVQLPPPKGSGGSPLDKLEEA